MEFACPHCGRELYELVKACPACGLSAEEVYADFTFEPDGTLASYSGTNTVVVVPNGVKRITSSAFYEKGDIIDELHLPAGVEVIEGGAFDNCSAITEITIPASVRSMGAQVFTWCYALSLIRCEVANQPATWDPDWNEDDIPVVWGEAQLPAIEETEPVFVVEDGVLLRYRGAVATVTIPKNVREIGRNVFSHHAEITSVIFHDGVVGIGASAFEGCVSLVELVLDHVERVGKEAFLKCKRLERVILGDVVREIGMSAFQSCTALERIEMGAGLHTIGESAFADCTRLREVTVGSGVKKIGAHAFDGCIALEQATLPDGLLEIGAYGFYNTYISSIVIPASVARMGGMVFEYDYFRRYIYCEAEEMPAGWDPNWVQKDFSIQVIYGYKREVEKETS